MGRLGGKTEAIIAFLGTSEAEGMTGKAIAERFGVHWVTVSKCKREALRRKASPAPAAFKAHQKPPEEEIERKIAGLSPEDQRRVLSEIAVSAPREGDRVSALSSLQRLDASQGVKATLGPREPMTNDERIDRLSRLLEACTRPVILAALRRARVNLRS